MGETMNCELLRYDQVSDVVLQRWEMFRQGSGPYKSPFFSPEFTRHVSEVRDDIRVLVFGDGEDVDLIWPLQVQGRSADPVGAPFCDYHGPVMRPGWSGDLQKILRKSGLSTVRLTGVYDPDNRLHEYASEFDGAYVTDLSQGAQAVFDFQQEHFPKHAKKMRRLGRKVEREIGELTFRFDDRDQAMWDELIAWKRQQYRDTGRHDVLAPEWIRQLLKNLWASEEPTCRGFLHTLRHGDKFIAGEFNLACRSTLHGWVPAYHSEYASYTPGFLIQNEILKEAEVRGFVHYDLGVSAGHYKKYYSSYQIPVVGGTIRSGSLVSQIGGAGEFAWTKIETSGIPKVSALAGQVRRRYRIIRSSETSMSGRMKGVMAAVKSAVKPPANASNASEN